MASKHTSRAIDIARSAADNRPMHTVRLRGPWQLSPVESAVTTEFEITVPGDWSALGADFPGPAIFSRRFGLPTNLQQESVWLVIEQVHARATIELNGRMLGTQLAAEGLKKFEITTLLQLRNQLRIQVEGASGKMGSLGEVRLEIDDSPT